MAHRRTSVKKIDFPRGRGLSTRAVVYVPSTKKDKHGKDVAVSPTEFKTRVRHTAGFLSKLFGGVTRVKGVGSWYNKKGVLVQENVAKVEAFAPTRAYKRQDVELEKYLNRKRSEWQQDSLSFEFETPEKDSSSLHFIGG